MRLNQTEHTLRDLHFPVGGLDLSGPFGRQRTVDLGGGVYARTAPVAENVRSVNPGDQRKRGGSRSGLSKWIAARGIGSTPWVVQSLTTLVGAGYSAPGGQTVQSSLNGRLVHVVKVQQGNVYSAVTGATAWTAATNSSSGTPPLNASGVIHAAAHNQKVYFADGTNYRYFDPADNTVRDWTASAGSLPADANGRRAKLIANWRGRILLAIDHIVYASAVGDATDWDTTPAAGTTGTVQTQAFVLSPSEQFGHVGDLVTCLVPYSNDALVVGTDHQIYVLRGDPMAGGWLDLVTDSIGMLWGAPWCRLPDGRVVFMSNRGGVYSLLPASRESPRLLSHGITGELDAINTGTSTVRMEWNDRERCVEIFVTPTGTNAATTHYVLEVDQMAFFRRVFADIGHNPLCTCALDGNEAEDRVVLIGCRDGYVRYLDPAADTDDGEPIESRVLIGPLLTPMLDELRVDQLQAVLGLNEDADLFDDPAVDVAFFAARTPEEAVRQATGADAEAWEDADAVIDRNRVKVATLGPGLSTTHAVRVAGKALYLELTSKTRWACETIRLRVAPTGGVRMRSGGGAK